MKSQYYLNCSNLTYSQLNNMNLSRGVTAVVCVIILTTMLVVLCISKAYRSIIQRLFLYLILASILDEICNAATLEHQFYYPYQSEVCAAVGFATHWCSTIVVECAVGVIAYTVLLICLSVKCNHVSNRTPSTRWKILLESMYLLIIIFLPLSVIWVPLMNGNYGLAVAWCWIRTVHENCEKVLYEEQLVMGYGGYEIVSIAGIIAFLGLTISYCKISTSYVQVKKLLLQSLMLTSFVLLYLVFANTGLTIRIYSIVTGWTQHYPMWIYHGVIIPLCQLIIPFGFLGSFYFKHIQNECCMKLIRRNQYQRVKAVNATCPVSDRTSMPSNTFFDVPYTNEFTSVRRTQAAQASHTEVANWKPGIYDI